MVLNQIARKSMKCSNQRAANLLKDVLKFPLPLDVSQSENRKRPLLHADNFFPPGCIGVFRKKTKWRKGIIFTVSCYDLFCQCVKNFKGYLDAPKTKSSCNCSLENSVYSHAKCCR